MELPNPQDIKLEAIQNQLREIASGELSHTLQPLPHRRDLASLSQLYRYLHEWCSVELHSLVPSFTSCQVYWVDSSLFPSYSIAKKQVPLREYFWELWNRHPRGRFLSSNLLLTIIAYISKLNPFLDVLESTSFIKINLSNTLALYRVNNSESKGSWYSQFRHSSCIRKNAVVFV